MGAAALLIGGYANAQVDYYYGVRSGEATSARPAYAGKDNYSPELGLLVRFRASPRQFISANFNYERYAKEIRSSPLMNACGIPQVVLGDRACAIALRC